MTSPERRKIEELIARYELEPQLCDVYVEGSCDQSVVEWFLKQQGVKNVAVYEISTVEVPAELMQQYGLDENNRGRVIALAMEFESNLGQQTLQVTCVVDSDLDLLLGQKHACTLLLYTDYTCIEMYLFNESCLDKFLCICLRGFPLPAHYVLRQLSSILEELFLIRLANKLLDLGLEGMTFQRCCILNNGGIVFDADDYITRYLNKSGMIAEKDSFIQVIESWRPKLTDDPRCQIHGHDFIDLLAWYISSHGASRELSNSKATERSLFGCIELDQLTNETLFRQLIDRIK